MHFLSLSLSLLTFLSTALALPAPSPAQDLEARANETVNPAAVTTTTCNDPNVNLNTHDTDVALLNICGGIAGSIEFCGGNPATTTGASGTSKFTLTPDDKGATINVSKGRWEGCVRAARATCPAGTFTSDCVGGTSTGGNFKFVLSANS